MEYLDLTDEDLSILEDKVPLWMSENFHIESYDVERKYDTRKPYWRISSGRVSVLFEVCRDCGLKVSRGKVLNSILFL